jgi:hypothetical protein
MHSLKINLGCCLPEWPYMCCSHRDDSWFEAGNIECLIILQFNYSKPSLIRNNGEGEEVIRISEENVALRDRKLSTQINGNLNDVSSADENKWKQISL